VDVPQAATILSAYQEARSLLIGRSVAADRVAPGSGPVFEQHRIQRHQGAVAKLCALAMRRRDRTLLRKCGYCGSRFSDGRKRVCTRYSSPRDQDSSVLPRMSTLIATKGSLVATTRT
jgi:hypothetical protein